MNTRSFRLLLCVIAATWLPLATAATSASNAEPAANAAQEQQSESSATLKLEVGPDDPKAGADTDQSNTDAASGDDHTEDHDHDHHYHGDNDNSRVHIGSGVSLGADESATNVVAIFGSATNAGTVDENVVSIFGDTRVTGSVGENAVAVFGSTYIDSHVKGDAVAVFGDLELGPNAIIDGDVTVVGGELKRASSAVLRHGPNEVTLGIFGKGTGIRVWVENCLMYLRPLAFAPGLGWAWIVAFSFLAFYALLALMFERPVEECVRTLETRPAQSIGVAFLSLLLTPFLFVLLAVVICSPVPFPPPDTSKCQGRRWPPFQHWRPRRARQ